MNMLVACGANIILRLTVAVIAVIVIFPKVEYFSISGYVVNGNNHSLRNNLSDYFVKTLLLTSTKW